jgi:hypothetical protein
MGHGERHSPERAGIDRARVRVPDSGNSAHPARAPSTPERRIPTKRGQYRGFAVPFVRTRAQKRPVTSCTLSPDSLTDRSFFGPG